MAILPLHRNWSLRQYQARIDRLNRKLARGKTGGIAWDELEEVAHFYDVGACWLDQRGPVDVLVLNVDERAGDLTFDLKWRCLACGEEESFDRPPETDDDEYICSCRTCEAVIGRWGTQRNVAKWLALEKLRFDRRRKHTTALPNNAVDVGGL